MFGCHSLLACIVVRTRKWSEPNISVWWLKILGRVPYKPVTPNAPEKVATCMAVHHVMAYP